MPDKIDMAKLLKQNQELIDSFNNCVGNPKYVKMLQGRKKLPAWNAGPSILDTMRNKQVRGIVFDVSVGNVVGEQITSEY